VAGRDLFQRLTRSVVHLAPPNTTAQPAPAGAAKHRAMYVYRNQR
jgi:hypothetical protein